MNKSIMFVDEEVLMHKALRRSFRKVNNQWGLRFATSPDQALNLLSDQPADLLITAVSFSGQSGLDLLREVRQRFPKTVRMVLSGSIGDDVILQSVDIAHQYLAKPFEFGDLDAAITRAFFVRDLMDNDDLQLVVSRIESLPSLPSIYVELVQALESEDASIAKVGNIVEKDLGLTPKLLKLANSSFFGRPQHISDPAKAVSLLGLDLVKAIVLASGVMDGFKKIKFKDFSIEKMWQHAMLTAALAKTFAQELRLDRQTIEDAFTAGLLHDVGKLLIAAYLPESFAAIVKYMSSFSKSMAAAEMQVLGTTHAAIGSYLLGLWGLPTPIIESVAFHHAPGDKGAESSNCLTIVHVANALANAGHHLDESSSAIDGLDNQFLAQVGILSHLNQWRKLAIEHLESIA